MAAFIDTGHSDGQKLARSNGSNGHELLLKLYSTGPVLTGQTTGAHICFPE
jgi:hypothetical protein